MSLPLSAIMDAATDDLRLLAAAENKLRAQCMKDRGFDQVTNVRYDDAGLFNLDRRYAHVTPEVARERGYRPVDLEALVAAATEPMPAFARSDDYLVALHGEVRDYPDGSRRPDGTGCEALAAEEIYGNAERRYGFSGWDALLKVNEDSYVQTMASEGVRAAESSWSQCMKRAGYDYASPQEPLADYPVDPSNVEILRVPVSNAELATAVADANCRIETNLKEVYFATESQIQLELIETHSDAVRSVRSELDDALTRANEIMSSD